MGCARTAKFGGGHTGESAMPASESDDDSDATDSTLLDFEAATLQPPASSSASKKRKEGRRKTTSEVDIPPALTREKEGYEDNKKREENRGKLGSSDAGVLRDISEMEAATKKAESERKLAASKEEADLALKTKNIAQEIKYAFKYRDGFESPRTSNEHR